MAPTFVAAQHDDGEKTVFGKTGRFGVDEVLDLIVRQPACGRYVAGRLIAYFGANDPQGRLRERMAAAFRDSHYEIRPMLKVLFTSPEFYDPAARGAQDQGAGPAAGGRLPRSAADRDGHARPGAIDRRLRPGAVQSAHREGLAGRGRLDQRQHAAAAIPAWARRWWKARCRAEPPPLGRLRLMAVSRDPAQAAATIKRQLDIDRERRQQKAEGRPQSPLRPGTALPARAAAKTLEQLADALLKPLVVTKVRAADARGDRRGLPFRAAGRSRRHLPPG